MRRARARNCKIERPAVSSRNKGELESLPAALVSRGKSRSSRKPSRTFRKFTRAREHNIRRTRDSAVISRLKTPTGSFLSTDTKSAMFMAREVLPRLGRAQHTQDEGLSSHFQAEDSDRQLFVHGH